MDDESRVLRLAVLQRLPEEWRVARVDRAWSTSRISCSTWYCSFNKSDRTLLSLEKNEGGVGLDLNCS